MQSLAKWWPVLLALPVLLGGGALHGLWTDRWSPSPHLAEAAAKLEALPEDIGPWTSVPYEQDAEALAMTAAVGHYSRTFTDPLTGEKVLVMLLAGKPAQMVVHKPEDCYRAAGFTQLGDSERIKATLPDGSESELFTGLFNRDEAAGPTQLRIFWSWYGSDIHKWQAPSAPRFHFARQPVLYKLYIVRSIVGPGPPLTEDPAYRLLTVLLPVLNHRLSS